MPPIEKTINRKLLVDMIVGSGVFQQLGLVPNNVTVTNIQFSDLFGISDQELTKMKIFGRRLQEQEVQTKRL